MGPTTLLKPLLRSFCHNTLWKYAVFWKLRHHSDMFLTWEDGYCNTSPFEFFTGTSRIISFGPEVDTMCGNYTGCSIELAVENMSSHLYTLGEGIIGNVALSGKHCWILVNSKSLCEYPEEWKLQTTLGIKTILLVPLPHGVVQLGSLQRVAENLTMVAQVKDAFASLQDTTDASSLSGGSISHSVVTSSRNFFASLSGNLLAQPLLQPPIKKDVFGYDMEQVTKEEQSSTECQLSQPFGIYDPLSHPDVEHILGTCLEEYSFNPTNDSVSVVPTQDLHVLNPCFGTDSSFLIECENSSFATEDTLLAHLHHKNVEQVLFTEQSSFVNSYMTEAHGQYDSSCIWNEIGVSYGNEQSDIVSHDLDSSILNLPVNYELHEALFMPTLDGAYDGVQNAALTSDGLCSSTLDCSVEESNHLMQFVTEFNNIPADENETTHLCAMASNLHYSSDENMQNIPRCARSSSNSSENFAGSCLTQNKCEVDVSEADHLLQHAKIAELEAFVGSPSGSSSKSVVLTKEKKYVGEPRFEINGVKKSSYVGKKKQKAGDPHKPRPRDRQLIQDRVKELRELVPHGEKCSIDALLDRTIKHMMFLKSVSSQAEKLKNCAYPMVPDKNSESEPQCNHNGATWAYEIGSKAEACPILVKNLDQPGQLLVEMLCTEYGDFLEIAQVIRHSELIILKGVMESRYDKLWACFVVEANRGFDRMNILWPLMRLMQQSCGPISSMC